MTSIIIDRTDGLSSSVAIKGPCKVATTANITLSGHQTIDGVAVVTDDRVLVKNQTTQSENGIWIVDTGSWRRAKDFSRTGDVVAGTDVSVVLGTLNANARFTVTTLGEIDVGTTAITFAQRLTNVNASNTIADLMGLGSSDVFIGSIVSVKYGSIYGGYGDGEFYVLSGSAASNGLTHDGIVVVENDDGNITFVRKRWKDEGKVDLLWWTPSLTGGDSATAFTGFYSALDSLTYAQGRVTGIIPDAGVPFLTSVEQIIDGQVRLTGGGMMKAHSTLPQGSNLLRSKVLSAGAGVYGNADIIIDDVSFDGAGRTFVAAGRQSLVRLFSCRNLVVRDSTFTGQESNLLALAGNLGTKVLDSNFSDWGFPTPGAGVDGGSAIIAIANPTDNTPNSELMISRNTIKDGLWCGIQAFSDYCQIDGNLVKDTKEGAIFCRNVNATSPGNFTRVGVIADNIVQTVGKAYIDGSGIVMGGGKWTVNNNIVRDTANIGISIVSETADLSVTNNTVINGNTDSVSFGNGGGILLRDADATLSPARITIKNNVVRDEQVTKTAKYGIAAFFVSPSSNTLLDVDISGNTVEGAALVPADNLYVDPAFIGARWNISDNKGASTWTRVGLPLFGNILTTIGAINNSSIVLGNGNTIYGPTFDPTAVEAGVMYWQLPPDWDGGNIYAKFIGSTQGAAGSVVWGISANSFANGDNLDIVHPANVTVTAGMNTNILSISSLTSAIAIGNTPVAGDHVALRLSRIATDAADTAPGDAVLFAVELFYGRTSYNQTWLS